MNQNFSKLQIAQENNAGEGNLLSISALILTFNEEKHIARCIESIRPICRDIFIVDSYSTDETITIAKLLGAKCYQRRWENNYAQQYNWGLANLPIKTEWILRLDADEYIMPELVSEVNSQINSLDKNVCGITINRRVVFMDRWIRYGGYYPTTLLRFWRTGSGILEERWMDEHVKLNYGTTVHFQNDVVDFNLNNLTWWTNKHNNYATREAIDFLIYKYNLEARSSISKKINSTQDKRKRWFKEKIYFNIPLFVRPFFYFIFRYFFKLGFLDGKQGVIWHFLQGFWYRFLVDAKIYEVYRKAGRSRKNILFYLENEYKVRLETKEE
jgi:glycosyltransferase involved in cell wall biosynthesis